MSRRLLSFAFLISLTAGFDLATAQAPTAGPSRPEPPTREPSTPGYVKAKELPDGTIPSPEEDGNIIIGPTHNAAPEMAANEGVFKGDVFEFAMESKDSKIYTGIAREVTIGLIRTPRLAAFAAAETRGIAEAALMTAAAHHRTNAAHQ